MRVVAGGQGWGYSGDDGLLGWGKYFFPLAQDEQEDNQAAAQNVCATAWWSPGALSSPGQYTGLPTTPPI